MLDVEKLLGQMVTSAIGGKRRRASTSSFGIPGVNKASLGMGAIGLAIAAFEHFRSTPGASQAMAATPLNAPPPPPPPPGAPEFPNVSAPGPLAPAIPAAAQAEADDGQRQADAVHLVRTMIAAANADGSIDTEERARILQHAMEAGFDPPTQQMLMAELRKPAALVEIVSQTPAALRLETYAAALLAIVVDTEIEHAWIEHLAQALNLSPEEREAVHSQLGVEV